LKKIKNKNFKIILTSFFFLLGLFFLALAFEEKVYAFSFDPIGWLSKLFSKKEDPLKLKINVPPPPPPTALYQNNLNASQNLETQVSNFGNFGTQGSPFPLQSHEPKAKSSPWQWY
jgi:hypothetical protein